MTTMKTNPFARKVEPKVPQQRIAQARQNPAVTDPNTGDFNPKLNGSDERAYNDAGELNAGSRREAGQRALGVMSTLASPANGRVAQETVLRTKTAANEAKWKRVAAEFQRDPNTGMQRVAQAIKQNEPIKQIGDYSAIHQRFLKMTTLKDGEFHRLPYDLMVGAYLVAPGGGGYARVIGGSDQKYLIAPEFGVQANFEMHAFERHTATWDMFARGEDTAKQNIMREKDKRFVAILDAASTQANAQVEFTQLSRAHFAQAKLRLGRWGFEGKQVLMHLNEQLSDLVGGNFVSDLDPVSQREIHVSGYAGRYGGWEFVIAHGANGLLNILPEGTLYFTAAPEFVGEAGVRVELDAMTYDTPVLGRAGSGVLMYSQMTMAVIGGRAIVKAIRVAS